MSPDEPHTIPVAMLQPPQLWEATFKRSGQAGDSEEESKQELGFELGFARTSLREVGVQMTVTVFGIPGVTLQASYRAGFRLERPDDFDDLESEMRTMGVHIGPSVLYPYLRESVSTIIQRAAMPPVVLPVMNFRAFFDLEEVEFPPAPHRSEPSRESEPEEA